MSDVMPCPSLARPFVTELVYKTNHLPLNQSLVPNISYKLCLTKLSNLLTLNHYHYLLYTFPSNTSP